MKRKLEKDTKEVKRLKKKLKLAKNKTEIRRIMIMMTYLWWVWMLKTAQIMQTSAETVKNLVDRYMEDKGIFIKQTLLEEEHQENLKK